MPTPQYWIIYLLEFPKQDLRSIGRYTQQTWGREQRNIYLSSLTSSFYLLAHSPTLGRACDDIRDGYRKYHIARHLIFYREADEGIEIIRNYQFLMLYPNSQKDFQFLVQQFLENH